MFRFVARWFRRRQRRVDRLVLFPAIRAQQINDADGDRAILRHVMHDSAWSHPDEWKDEGIEEKDQ